VKIPISWLRDYVDVPEDPEEIGRTLSAHGFAVEGLEQLADGDTVVDVEVTANRPDCLSVIGMAREVATALGRDVREVPGPGAPDSGLRPLEVVERGDVDVVIENPDLCPRYAGAVADVTIAASPTWMQGRLQAAGVRPISNVVDVTNYVLLELGQPMHAFDLARLRGGEIRVRTAKGGETLRTLDGQTRELSPDVLVIADAERPAAIAGVMGGAESEVAADSTAIVLESAHFAPLTVRRTSKRLGLKTEASMRFERGVDPRLPVIAMQRACALLEMTGAGRSRGTVVDRHPQPAVSRVLRLRRDRITGLLGASVPDPEVRRILQSLGFTVQNAADGWEVVVPTRRIDVLREVDLIEEVARHYGFDRIPATFPALLVPAPASDPRIAWKKRLCGLMTSMGFSEAVTFGFTSEKAVQPFVDANEVVPIKNPLSEAFAVLRPSLLPTLLESVAHNVRREQRDVRLFEAGSVFTRTAGEQTVCGVVWTGAADSQHWSSRSRDIDFFDITGVVEGLCHAHGAVIETRPSTMACLVEGRQAVLQGRAEALSHRGEEGLPGDPLGITGQLAPAVAGKFGIPETLPVYVAELNLETLFALPGPVRVSALPKFPSVVRDLSILVDDSVSAASMRQTIDDLQIAILEGRREFDRYHGKGIPDGRVSLSFRLTFRSPERTLTDTEVQTAVDSVLRALTERHGATQR
jgi:phenylalanyl-tRNA synthetase beta chain